MDELEQSRWFDLYAVHKKELESKLSKSKSKVKRKDK